MTKNIYITLAFINIFLACIGAVLPLVPAFPFVFLAAYFFAKSSKKLHDWFIATKLYRHNLETYVNGRTLKMKTKVLIMLGVSFTSIYGFFVAKHFNLEIGIYLMPLIWFSNFIYFFLIVKTHKQ